MLFSINTFTYPKVFIIDTLYNVESVYLYTYTTYLLLHILIYKLD